MLTLPANSVHLNEPVRAAMCVCVCVCCACMCVCVFVCVRKRERARARARERERATEREREREQKTFPQQKPVEPTNTKCFCEGSGTSAGATWFIKRIQCEVIVFYFIVSHLYFSTHLVHKEAPKRVGRVYSHKGIVVSATTGAHSQKVSVLVYAHYIKASALVHVREKKSQWGTFENFDLSEQPMTMSSDLLARTFVMS